MTYNSIPIPEFNFTEVPEEDANDFFNAYLKSPFLTEGARDITYHIDELLNEHRHKQDKIIVLSVLINKLTEKIVNLTDHIKDDNSWIIDPRKDYRKLLQFLYRLIENEGITIPSDIFSENDYKIAQGIIANIDKIIEDLKTDNPDKIEELTAVQEEVKKSAKFLWLGKEKWGEVVFGTIAKVGLEKGIFPLIAKAIALLGTIKFLT